MKAIARHTGTLIGFDRKLMLLMAFGAAASLCYAAPADEVTKARQEINKANDAHDAATMARLLTDDFVFISRTGTMTDKKTFLANIGSGRMITGWAIDDVRIRIYGNCAVMTERMTGNARSGPVTIRTTNAFAKQGGNWKAASLAASPVAAQTSQ